ncbi:hypothetical protein SDC9_106028 [bioreactor metagenome]|uniref:VTT domain-containing protein n=1 Tax=bioreactor metagenome TaxID=1076179 RepID=A0A645B284_9ZZZZ
MMYWLTLSEGKHVSEFYIFLSCLFGMPLPEEITLLSSGIFVAAQKLKLHQAIIAGVAGVFISDMIYFILGKQLGGSIFKFKFVREIITKSRLTKAESYISTNAAMSCFIGRFVPVFRVVIFSVAGMLNVRPIIFFIVDLLAGMIYVSFWVIIGEQTGLCIDAFKYLEKIKIIIMLLGLLLLLLSAVRHHLSRRLNGTQK